MKRYLLGLLTTIGILASMMGVGYIYIKYPIALILPVIMYILMYFDVRHTPVQDSR